MGQGSDRHGLPLDAKLWSQTSVQVTRFRRPTAHATAHAAHAGPQLMPAGHGRLRESRTGWACMRTQYDDVCYHIYHTSAVCTLLQARCASHREGLRAPSLWRHRTAPELPLSHPEPIIIHSLTSLPRPNRRGASPGCSVWPGAASTAKPGPHACASPRWLSFCAWQALGLRLHVSGSILVWGCVGPCRVPRPWFGGA
jgi:hypothetical protein